VLIITLINGLAGGFIGNASDNFSHLLAGHIFVEGREKTPSGRVVPVIRDDRVLLAALDRSKLAYEHLMRRSSFTGTLIFEGESLTLRVDGVDWQRESYLRQRLTLRRGSWEAVADPRAVVLSEEIARKLGAEVGDSLLVSLRTVSGQQNAGELRLGAVYYDPGLFSTVSAYASLQAVSELLGLAQGEYMTLGILLPDIRVMERDAIRYREALSRDGAHLFPRRTMDLMGFGFFGSRSSELDWQGTRFQLSTLNDYLGQLNQIVNILKVIGLLILLVLFFIIMVGITNTYRMIMYERTRESGGCSSWRPFPHRAEGELPGQRRQAQRLPAASSGSRLSGGGRRRGGVGQVQGVRAGPGGLERRGFLRAASPVGTPG
jgi:putative ABC transport system permease protein